MEQQTQKKEWKTPEMTVLVRSKPEEAVLLNCKAYTVGTGNDTSNHGCWTQNSCGLCQSVDVS